jgi:hypothetical protein
MCCRARRAESTHSRLRFKRIPEGPCAKAGPRYAGAAAVYGLHANSRWWCVDNYRASQRSTSKGEVGVLDPIPPSALPTDRFCAGCARLLVN